MVSGELAEAPEVACIAPARWRAVWPNPCHGHEALYIASHAFGIEGMEPIEAQALIADLLEQATRRDGVYCHAWRPGDVIVWDERAMMHRGRPWPLDEERTLIATVISARRADGLDLVRPPIPLVIPIGLKGDRSYVPSNAARPHPRPWLASHKLGRAVALARR